MVRAILVGWFCVATGMVAPALASDSTSSSVAPSAVAVPIAIEVMPKEPVWILGKDYELTVTIRHPGNVSTFFPVRLPLDNFIQKEVFERQESHANGDVERVITFVLTPIRFDVIVLPDVELSWVLRPESGGESKTGTMMVELGRIRVDGVYQGDGTRPPGAIHHCPGRNPGIPRDYGGSCGRGHCAFSTTVVRVAPNGCHRRTPPDPRE